MTKQAVHPKLQSPLLAVYYSIEKKETNQRPQVSQYVGAWQNMSTGVQDVPLMLQAGEWNHGTVFVPSAQGTLSLKRHISEFRLHVYSLAFHQVFKWSVKARTHQY